jgi:hypothetical protein
MILPPDWAAPYIADLQPNHFLPPFAKTHQRQWFTQLAAHLRHADETAMLTQLHSDEWRLRWLGNSWIAVLRFDSLTSQVAESLRQYPQQARAQCIALARCNSTPASQVLVEYLAQHLHTAEVRYWESISLDWAMAALRWLDEQHHTQLALPFLAKHGAWTHYVTQGIEQLIHSTPHYIQHPLWIKETHLRWIQHWNLTRLDHEFGAALALVAQSCDVTA